MIDELFSTAIFGSLISVLSLAVALWTRAKLRTGDKTLLITHEDGHTETVVVNASATTHEIRERVREAVDFELALWKGVTALAVTRGWKASRGKAVDFLVEAQGQRIGIEAKYNASRVDRRQVEKYLNAAKGIERVLVFTRSGPSERLLAEFRANGPARAELITVTETGEIPGRLELALDKALQAAAPHTSD